jgi:hypothetical protein
MYRCLPILLVLACRSASTNQQAGVGDATSSGADVTDARDGSNAHDAAAMIDGAVDGAAADAAVDSGAVDSGAIDAAVDAGYSGSDAGTPGVVSCYSEGNPTATCTLPTHCCFTNYSAQHNGSCTNATCGWGTISCDGPEDCSGGQRCCAHALQDSSNAFVGYTLACQQNPCGPTPLNEELCHPTTSPAGTCSTGSCVNTLGYNNDLPRTLAICR